MTENDDTHDQTPEEVTLRDLWQHISGMEARLNQRFDAKIDSASGDLKADIVDLKADIAGLKDEAQATREVVDTLASDEDFNGLDRKISAVSADTQATRQAVTQVKAEVSRLRADVKSAGIPVR